MSDDDDCPNCHGVRCMDCVFRVMHDECVEDCPICCDDTPDHGEAEGILLVLAVIGIVAVVVFARWGWAGLAWMAVVHGACVALFALMVLCASHDHGKDYDR